MKLPRFSLRELFLLVVIAAMGCGWWVHYRAMTSALKAERESKAAALKAQAQSWRKFMFAEYRAWMERQGLDRR